MTVTWAGGESKHNNKAEYDLISSAHHGSIIQIENYVNMFADCLHFPLSTSSPEQWHHDTQLPRYTQCPHHHNHGSITELVSSVHVDRVKTTQLYHNQINWKLPSLKKRYPQIIYDSCRGGRPRQGKSSTLVKYLVHPSTRHATCLDVELQNQVPCPACCVLWLRL